nr:hypothetical protein [Desulfobulbaceae bacterium]
MADQPTSPKDSKAIAAQICKLSEFNTTNANDLVLHFQTLISAHMSKAFMEAPGLYFPKLDLYVISTSGLSRGHASLHKSIEHLIPEDKRLCYAFVLYPGSFIRACLDKVLRKTAKTVAKDILISMENVFNRKWHKTVLVDSDIEKELIALLKNNIQ